jgi:carbonic anhydrase
MESDNVEFALVPVGGLGDLLPEHCGTPVGDLLAYHNLGAPHRVHSKAELLIGMCMDNRMQLRIPPDFAFVLRCAGANTGMLQFDVSFAITVGGVRSICLIGHDECRMVDVGSKREAFVSGLVDDFGWDRVRAEQHFDDHCALYGFDHVPSFVWSEAKRLRRTYPGINVSPLVYSIDDRSLCQMTDSHSSAMTVTGEIDGRTKNR